MTQKATSKSIHIKTHVLVTGHSTITLEADKKLS